MVFFYNRSCIIGFEILNSNCEKRHEFYYAKILLSKQLCPVIISDAGGSIAFDYFVIALLFIFIYYLYY